MATTGNKTAQKSVAKAEQVQKSEPVSVSIKKKKWNPSDPVNCVSITAGELGMIGIKSGINYRWAERGDVTEVEYQDVIAAIRSSTTFVMKPYFIIQEPDIVDEFPQIKKIYDKMYTKGDLEDIFRLPAGEMKKAILELPEGAKETIKHIAATKLSNGTLDSIKKIRVIDEIFNTELLSLTNL